MPCYASLSAPPEKVDAVLVVVPPLQALEVVHQTAASGIHHVWLPQGAESPLVIETCRGLGLDVVSGECVLMFAEPKGVHKARHWIHKVTHQLPAS